MSTEGRATWEKKSALQRQSRGATFQTILRVGKRKSLTFANEKIQTYLYAKSVTFRPN
uniref:Uncharacterized protein n=1 Tax=Anguilla anguilla TaxID=7936 RepID=A0A0E9V347_ANGAN